MRLFNTDLKKFFNTKNIITAAICIVLVAAVICAFIFVKPNNPDNDKSGSSSAVDAPASSTPSSEPESSTPPPEINLQITSPNNDSITTTNPTYTLSGTSDPAQELKINGETVKRNSDGSFNVVKELKVGKNTFKFEHKGKTVTKTVTYNYVVIKDYSPSGKKTYNSGSVISVSVTARNGSSVTATFNGSTVNCKKATVKDDQDGGATVDDTFVNYTATFTLPSNNTSQLSLGKITFEATCNGVTEKKYSGEITVEKSSIINSNDPAVTPSGGDYINVGSGLIAAVVANKAETFSGKVVDDDSRPYNCYLPEGTQDYCAEGTVTYQGKEYYKLRCGRRIYTKTYLNTSYQQTVAETSVGTLPDHNELSIISFDSEGKYTTLTLESDWKAPFYFELKNQSYSEGRFAYSVSSVTFSYVDITFCYATVFEGEITVPDNHPIFKSAEIIKNESDTTLRLTLKKTGGFYGWDCYYDSNDNLVFKFLNPAKMENTDSLSGITVYLDVGHGGSDVGATAGSLQEGKINLALAIKIKERLEAKNATVIMNRTSDSTTITPPKRIENLISANADICIAIHHDNSSGSSANGFLGAYYTPFSYNAANFIWNQTNNANIYKKIWALESHYYYVARATCCPIVLTENGFMSNAHDYEGIINDAVTDKKADAIVAGIIDYFISIQ